MDDRQDHLSEDSQWSVYEGNVQAYRGLALSAQAIYLAVGALLLPGGQLAPFLAVFALAMVTSWYVWAPAIFARTAIVDFHKFRLGELFERDGTLATGQVPTEPLRAREYARTTGWTLRRRVYAGMRESGFPGFRTLRLTRFKIDLVLPSLFTIVWLVFTISLVAG